MNTHGNWFAKRCAVILFLNKAGIAARAVHERAHNEVEEQKNKHAEHKRLAMWCKHQH
jgi:hypothetical protein